MKMVGSWLFLLIFLQGYEAPSTPNVNCLFINLDYVNCTWSEQGSPEVNYTFFHKRFIKGNMEECTTYLQEKSYAVGCRLSYDESDRFRTLTTKLVHQNNSYVQKHNLKSMVKLYPPVNLSVEMNKDPELNLYWNNSKNTACIESEVRYRINSDKWKTSTPSKEQKYAVAFPLKSSRYEFQVRARVNNMCGESNFWSEWSQPIQWDSMNGNNITDISGSSMSVWKPVLSLVGTMTLLILACMLVYRERERLRFILIVPNPGKNLEDLLHKDTVEAWLHISKMFASSLTSLSLPVLFVSTVWFPKLAVSVNLRVTSPSQQTKTTISCNV
ncbi:LOW QUALITY PROTEIN: cytokine receptor common subunit gamma [Salmo salar]|uniref:LOW QUALITY PROTEIN: cytokine receptor common subunit gamma n=1 Tax=Salmo salar TaxID=8030 RepID=A0A1S3L366_SALSA|nr:LOW QUALITY PROTEIN: cytokine receptor common subunit gamma [Salmo salar]|eukprot:XP_013984994.1 PREDICTED: LOW QUALITY PROTEIN: cytokine receptor common subunit gamma-like [Salmo salar]